MSEPLLRVLADDVWCRDEILGAVRSPVRMTVVRWRERELLLYSPLRISDDLARELDELGTVTDIVCPNSFHHLFAGKALARYPDARLWGNPHLAKKRADLAFTDLFDGTERPPWSDAVEHQLIPGMPWVNEVELLHRASRTLVVSDLLMHNPNLPLLRTRLAMGMIGAAGGPKQTWFWRFSTRDRDAARPAVERILAWDFDRVVMSHGEVIDTGAREILARSLAWLGVRNDRSA